ncbi:MAG: hypothetical protein V7701_02100 [Sneathiella sp.]
MLGIMRPTPHIYVRIVIALVAITGLIGALPVSYSELGGGQGCPHLGPIPACHIVSMAYLAIFISVVFSATWHPFIIVTAWSVILILAAIGTGMELSGAGTCPKTASGIPKCYFSLGLAGLLSIPLLFHYLASKQKSKACNDCGP